MLAAKIFTLLFLSQNFWCRQSQNIKVRKKNFVLTISEYQIRRTIFACSKKFRLKKTKIPLKTMLLEFFSYFYILRISTAKILTLLFLS